ncbi:MAG: helix-hairpin-helix domain-containing protein, partial [bacterium]|nr:helix-hairpin-helix domain-containing protein [bacterium]
ANDVEDLIDTQELEDEDVVESLQKYMDDPLDLNTALAEELQQLPEVTPLIALRIIQYRKQNKGFKNIDELRKVAGIEEEMFNNLKPYVKVGFKEIKVKEEGREVKKLVKEKDKVFGGRFILRMYSRRPMDDAYLSRTTNTGISSYKFLYDRLDIDLFRHFHFEFMGERDVGEAGDVPGRWFKTKELEIYDMVTKNFYVDKFGPVTKVLVGDYRLETGQGLVFGNSSKGTILKQSIYKDPVKKKDKGIAPHHTANMSRSLYGAVGQFQFGPVMVMPIFSKKKWDVQLKNRITADTNNSDDNDADGLPDHPATDPDGPGNEIATASSLEDIIRDYSDIHISETEKANKELLEQVLYGGRVKVELLKKTISLGSTYYYTKFNHLIDPYIFENPYLDNVNNRFYEFRGRDLNLGSFDLDLYFRNFNLYAEIGRSWHRIETFQTNRDNPRFPEYSMITNLNGTVETGYGRIIGLISDFKPIRLSTLYYDLDVNFYSPFANVFNEDDRNVQGVLQGIYGKFSRDLKIWAYAKAYRNKWRSYNLPVLSYKQEYKGGFENRVVKNVTFEWQGTYQYGTDQYDPEEKRRYVLRYQLDWLASRMVNLRFRYEDTVVRFPYRNNEEDHEYDYGQMAYAHIKIKPTQRLSLYNRFMYYSTTSSESAVYVYENELSLWPVPVRSFSGKGYRFFLYLSNQLTKEFSFEAKYSVTHPYNLEKTYDPTEHDYRFQIVYKW